jgi:carotenoid 1,2-hydratase
VFSPYYAAARRRGRGDPEHHCALNVALYGRPNRWSLTERGRGALRRDAATLAIGPSALHFDGTSLTIDIDERGMPLPHRLKGRLKVHFEALNATAFRLDAQGLHRWWPIAPFARVDVALESPDLRWSGHAYFDTNDGAAPLEHSFRHWHWSRATGTSATTVFYDVTECDGRTSSLALRIGRDGSLAAVEAPPEVSLPPTMWRVSRTTRAGPGRPVAITKTLEDAPFYARSLLATHLDGQPATAVHESLDLERFDRRWVQMLLPFRMPRRSRWHGV